MLYITNVFKKKYCIEIKFMKILFSCLTDRITSHSRIVKRVNNNNHLELFAEKKCV